jgi:ceramide glucosyltransferase
MMVSDLLIVLTVFGAVLVVAMYASQCRVLRFRPGAEYSRTPPVSVLKPLKGADSDLADNLRTFFLLTYPSYELVFGTADPHDPSLEVARRVAAEHPHVTSRFVVSEREVGLNPKVNNLANMAERARYELLLISDSNVAVPSDYLQVMVGELHRPGVGLVTSPIRGIGESGLGGVLERCQLNTFVMGGVAAVSLLFRRACSVGKSMLVRRSDLERIGGFRELGRYLAEDQVTGEAIERLGLRAVVAPQPVDNVLGNVTLRGFFARHLRWARIRRHTSSAGYALELLTNPVLPALALVAVDPGSQSFALLAGTVLLLSIAGYAAEWMLGVSASPLWYPPLVFVRGVVAAVLWPVALLSSGVKWRGHRFRIGRHTLLRPDPREPWPTPDELQSEEAPA